MKQKSVDLYNIKYIQTTSTSVRIHPMNLAAIVLEGPDPDDPVPAAAPAAVPAALAADAAAAMSVAPVWTAKVIHAQALAVAAGAASNNTLAVFELSVTTVSDAVAAEAIAPEGAAKAAAAACTALAVKAADAAATENHRASIGFFRAVADARTALVDFFATVTARARVVAAEAYDAHRATCDDTSAARIASEAAKAILTNRNKDVADGVPGAVTAVVYAEDVVAKAVTARRAAAALYRATLHASNAAYAAVKTAESATKAAEAAAKDAEARAAASADNAATTQDLAAEAVAVSAAETHAVNVMDSTEAVAASAIVACEAATAFYRAASATRVAATP